MKKIFFLASLIIFTLLATVSGQKPTTHLVQPGETIYSLTRRYQISFEELLLINPELKEGLKTGQILRLTNGSQIPEKQHVTINDTTITFYYHKIKRKETIYGISRQYEVSIEALKKYNPHILDGIHPKQVLKIPVYNITRKQVEKVVEPIVEPIIIEKPVEEVIGKLDCRDPIAAKKMYNVAIMLPFYLDKANRFLSDDEYMVENVDTMRQFGFMQYYLATLLAIDSLEKRGLNARIYFYDVDQSLAKAEAVLRKPEIKDMHLIIGPLFSQSFDRVARFANANKIRIVNPLSGRNEFLRGNTYAFKAQPDLKYQPQVLTDFITTNFGKDNIVIVRQSPESEAATAGLLKQKLPLTSLNEVITLRDGFGGINEKLHAGKKNIIVALSHDKVFVIDLIRKLNDLGAKYQLQCIGLSQWEAFGIEAEHSVALQLHMPSQQFTDFSSENTKRFVGLFREKYKIEPQQEMYAFAAYDITFYFLSALMNFGAAFEPCLPAHTYQGMQIPFSFISTNGNGWENTNLSIYRIDDYQQILVNPKK
ncbi:MAG: LysM peptidoglycan-binding domain-containing protein [Bacteroidales bacterium]|nr:LysM peptidoglycan-binding domain-containing protein [Bacteroidales bacterium]MDZ4204021.1 LysM peptidoglycan-binding domain-containing protein [Bacteroidales bacterium]